MNQAATDSDPWELAKARFLDDLDPAERQLFENATLENIYYSTSNINRSDAENSKTRFVVQKLGPLVSAIEGYGKALDTMAQIAPLYLAPIWGAIRVVLVVARAHGKFFEKVSEVLERIGDVLPRFRDYEQMYDQRKHPQLTQALSNAYLDIIIVCRDFRKSLQKQKASTVRRLLKPAAINPEFDSAIEHFRRHRDNVRDVVSHIHLIEAAEHQNAELVLLAEDRRRKLLSKLSKLDSAQRHRKLKSARHDGTGLWLNIHPEYIAWQTSAHVSSVLCCYGIPGSGKSVLVSSIIDHLDTNNSVFYYYCDYADKRTLEPANIWGTLSRQILEGQCTIPDTLAIQIDEAAHDGERLFGHSTALQILKHAVELCPGPIYLIFDGIDEASEASQKLICHGFRELLKAVSIRLIITGREEMGSLLRPGPGVPFSKIPVSQSAIAFDIEMFVRASTRRLLEDGSLVLQDPSLEEMIVKKLVEGAQGMFLWVDFQLRDLCEPESDHGIKLVLENLPRNLSETYDRLLSKIEGSERRVMTARMFKWIVCARQPLFVDQLREGIAFTLADLEWDSGKIPTQFSRLVRACGNLVLVDEETDAVQLAHYTVQQYLLSRQSSPFYFTLQQANTMAGETCVAYLNFTNFDTQMVLFKKNTNTDMAALEKFATSRTLVSPDNPGKKIVQVWNALRGPGRGVVDINMASHIRQRKPKSPELSKFELLPYVTAHWLWHTIDFDLGEQWQLRGLDQRDRIFIDLAMTKDLLFDFRPWKCFDNDYSNDSEENKMARQQLIGWALINNHSYLVRVAFREKIEFSPDEVFWTCYNDRELPNALEALGENMLSGLVGSEEPKTPSNPWVPDSVWLCERMFYACQKGHLSSIAACLDYLYPLAVTQAQLLVVSAAAGHLDLVIFFCTHEHFRYTTAYTVKMDIFGCSFNALDAALIFGHKSIAERLMFYGFTVTAFANLDSYFKILEEAVAHDCLTIVESLFLIPDFHNKTRYNLNIDWNPTLEQLVSDQRMSAILVQAIWQGNQRLLEILLQNGVSPNVPDAKGSIPLIAAIDSGDEFAVRTLAHYGCSMGNTPQGLPLTLAVSLGQLEIAELLVEGGAEVFGGTFAQESTTALVHCLGNNPVLFSLSPTPLYMASLHGYTAIAELLIRKGAAVDLASIQNELRIKLNENTTTAIQTYRSPYTNFVPYVRSASQTMWEYPLEAAVRQGHWEMVQLLQDSHSSIASVVLSQPSDSCQHYPDFMIQSNTLRQTHLDNNESVDGFIERTILTNVAKSLMDDMPSTYPQVEVLVAAGAYHDEIRLGESSLFLWALEIDQTRLQSIILAAHPNPDALRLRTLEETLGASSSYIAAIERLLRLEARSGAGDDTERIAELKHIFTLHSLQDRNNTAKDAFLLMGMEFLKCCASRTLGPQQNRRLRSIAVTLCVTSNAKLPANNALQRLNSENGGSFKMLLTLLKISVPPSESITFAPVDTLLFPAILSGDISMVVSLCDQGALVNNTGGFEGATPLIFAVANSAPIPMLKTLIALGSDLETVDEANESALHKAILMDNSNVLEIVDCLLFDHGFPIPDSHLAQMLQVCNSTGREEIRDHISQRNLDLYMEEGGGWWLRKPGCAGSFGRIPRLTTIPVADSSLDFEIFGGYFGE